MKAFANLNQMFSIQFSTCLDWFVLYLFFFNIVQTLSGLVYNLLAITRRDKVSLFVIKEKRNLQGLIWSILIFLWQNSISFSEFFDETRECINRNCHIKFFFDIGDDKLVEFTFRADIKFMRLITNINSNSDLNGIHINKEKRLKNQGKNRKSKRKLKPVVNLVIQSILCNKI